jgi:hypothetical protein
MAAVAKVALRLLYFLPVPRLLVAAGAGVEMELLPARSCKAM